MENCKQCNELPSKVMLRRISMMFLVSSAYAKREQCSFVQLERIVLLERVALLGSISFLGNLVILEIIANYVALRLT